MTAIDRSFIFTDVINKNDSEKDSEIQSIVDSWNNHNSGTSRWLKAYTSENVSVGLVAVTNFTATAAAGGTVPNGTYYYKVYSYDVNGFPGFYSPEVSVVLAGANGTVNCAWTAVAGVSYYRVSRGTSSGSAGGYFQVATNSLVDSGQAFSGAGNGVVNNGGSISAYGTIDLQASMGGIRWYNFTDNVIYGSLSCTSAGEMEFSTSKGSAQGNYLFNNCAAQAERLKIVCETSPVDIIFTDPGGWIDGEFQGATMNFQTGSNSSRVDTLNLSNTQVKASLQVAITPTTNQLVLGATRTVTITAPTPGTTSRTWTIPDNAGNMTFAAREVAETFSGAKTFSSSLFVTAAPTNAYDTTNIFYVNVPSPSTTARVLRLNGAIATDQMIYSPANLDEVRIATTTGTTITDYFIVKAAVPQVQIGNGSSGVNIRMNTASSTGANTASMTNSPTAGNPTEWIQVNINGNTRRIPCWA